MHESLPITYRETFARLRQRLHRLYIVEWALIGGGVFLLTLGGFMLADRLFQLSGSARYIFFYSAMVGFLVVGSLRYFSKAFFKRDFLALAQFI